MKRRIPVLKRLIPSLKRRIARWTSVNGFSLRRSNGAVFLLNTENYVDRQIALYDDFEAEQIAYLFAKMTEFGCDLFVDIGANIGFYSVLAARHGRAAQICAFEPDPRNQLQLGANILINRLTGRIIVIPKAVSAVSGPLSFQPGTDRSTGQSRISDAAGTTMVEAVRLDDAIPESGQRIFMKIDIEGHELAAIAGMTRLAQENRLFLQVEAFDRNLAQVKAALWAIGLTHRHCIGDDHYFANF